MVEDETKDKTIELFVHRAAEERVTLRTVASTMSIDTAVQLQDGEQVWLEESVEVVDVTLTLAECEIPHRGHVHVNRCAEVATSVTYNGVTKEPHIRSCNPLRARLRVGRRQARLRPYPDGCDRACAPDLRDDAATR